MFTNFLTTLKHASHTALREINMFHYNSMATLLPHTSSLAVDKVYFLKQQTMY